LVYDKINYYICIYKFKNHIIMTNLQVIKANGFSTKRLETSNYRGVFGGTCNHVVALVNAKNEVLHHDGKPYFPCGRNHAFASLIKSGDINAECFTFKTI